MARFGDQGNFYFGPQDAVKSVVKVGSGSFAGSAAFTASGIIDQFGSGVFAGAGVFSADGRAVSETSGSFIGTSTFSAGTQQSPQVTSVTASGAQPFPNEAGVVINGIFFGPLQGTVSYGGVTANVTNWTPTAVTITWPALFDDSPLIFDTDFPVIVSNQGGVPSNPFSQRSGPNPVGQYALIGARDQNLAPDEALFDDDTLGAGDTYVYGFESPAAGGGDWDFSGLSNWYINAVPDGGTFTYRLEDKALGQWSNAVTETFEILGAAIIGSGSFAGSSALQADSRLVEFGSGLFAGTAAFSADGDSIWKGSGQWSGGAAMAAEGRISTGTGGAFVGTATFVGNARVIGILAGAGAFAGASSVAADARVGGALQGAGSWAGASMLQGVARGIFDNGGIFAGSSSFSANGIIPSQTIGPIDKPGLVSLGARGVRGSQGKQVVGSQ